MSDTVDTRVVRMEFDNKQFEKNIKKTNQSLQDLKQNLDFEGVGESLDEVKVKVSALDIVFTTFIVNIANKIANLGVAMVRSLSVDNISAGWAKFGEKTTSVATMMAQKIRIAGQEITDLGEKTEIVTKQLELLTWFADETSYSFTDMVNSVGKFTAAGQDLDASVKAMEGIATWAALSGQNAQTASRAMYQLAQAMGKGKIQKIDWMSIQNANMDTEEFRETILATAVAMGQLTKEGDQFVTKTGKKFKQAQFSEYLSEGWFTSDVLVQGLNKYSAAIDEIYRISQAEGIPASEVIERYGDTLDQFGLKAFKAAQEARTFTDVINSVKDAVSSKWMTTFEAVFGTQQEAVRLWTDLANELYEVFAESGNFRNNILSVWKELGGRDDLFAKGGDNQGAFWNIYDAIIAVKDLIKSAWDTVFPLTEMEKESAQAEEIGRKIKGLTARIREFTEGLKMNEAVSSRLSKIFQGLFNLLKVGANLVRAIRFVLDPLLVLGKNLIAQVLDQITYYGGKLTSMGSKFESIVIKLRDMLVDLLETINPEGILSDVLYFVQKLFALVADFKPITRFIGFIKSFVTSLKETTDLKSDLGNFFGMIRSGMNLVAKVLYQVLTIAFKLLPVISTVLNVAFKFLGYIFAGVSKLIGFISKLGKSLFDFLAENQLFEKIKNSIVAFLQATANLLKPLLNLVIKAAQIVGQFVKNILQAIPHALEAATKAISGSGLIATLGNILSGIIDVIKEFIVTSGKIASNTSGGLAKAFHALFDGLATFLKGLIPVLQVILTVLGNLLKAVGRLLNKVANAILNVLTGKSVTKIVKLVFILTAILLAVRTIYWLFWGIKSTLFPLAALMEQMGDVLDGIAMRLKADVISSIANSLLKMAVALSLIGSINEADLVKALAAITILFGLTVAIIAILAKLSDSVKIIHRRSRSIKKSIIGIFDQIRENKQALQNMIKVQVLVRAVSSLATSLIKASAALLILSKIPEDMLYKCLFVAMAILGFMVGITVYAFKNIPENAAEKLKKTLKSVSGVVVLLIGTAIALRILSGQSWQSILAASGAIIAALGGILGVLVITSKFVTVTKDAKKAIAALLRIATSLIAISIALRIVASAGDWKTILASSAAIITVLYAMLGILLIVQKFVDKDAVGTFALFAASLIPFTMAIKILSRAIYILGKVDPARVWSSMLAIVTFTGLMIAVAKAADAISPVKFVVFSAALIPFAVAMETMSIVFATLSALHPGKVWNSVAAIVVFTGLMIAVARLADIISPIKFTVFSVSLIAFAVAMELMSAVVATLAALDYGKVWNGIAAISVFTLIIMATAQLANMISPIKFAVFSVSLMAFAVAMQLMSLVIVTLSALEYGKMWSSVGAILAFMTIVILVIKLTSLVSALKFAVFSLALMKFATAMLLMSASIAALAVLDPKGVKSGRQAIQVFLLAIVAIIKLIGILSTLKFGVFAGALMKFAQAMLVMSVSIATLAVLDAKSVENGRRAIQVFLLAVVAIIKLLGFMSAINFGIFAISLQLFATAMLTMSGVIAILGAMDTGSLWKAIGAMLAMLSGLVLLGALVQASHSSLALIGLAIGMSLFATAMVPFVASLLLLSSVSLAQLGKSMLVLAASMLVLIAIGAIARPFISTIMLLAAAMVLVGVGMLAAGMGLSALAAGLEAIAAAFVAQMDAIRTILLSLATILTDVIFTVLENLMGHIGELTTMLFDVVGVLIDNVLNLLMEKGPKIIETVVTILDILLRTLAEHADSIFSSVFSIITSLLTQLADKIGPIADQLFTILLKLMDKLIEYAPEIVKKLLTFIVVVVTALFDNIGPVIDVVLDRVFEFVAKVIVGLTRKTIALAGLIAKVILIMTAAALKITIASLGALGQIMLSFIAGILMLALHIFLGMNNVLYQIFKTVIYNVINMIGKVIRDFGPLIIKVGKNLIMNIIAGLLNTLAELVKDIPLLNLIPFGNWAKSIANAADDTFEDAILSGQNVTNAIAEAGQNITNVITQTSNSVQDAASVGMEAISDAVSTAAEDLGDALGQFGEDAGQNLIAGITNGAEDSDPYGVGESIGDEVIEGYSDSTETHSPSRVFIKMGEFLMKGLSLGVRNSESEAEEAIEDVVSRSLQLANDIINDQADDDLTIKVGMDISSVEAQASRISDVMSGISDPTITPMGVNAEYNARAMARRSATGGVAGASTTTNNNSNDVTYNNVFNITSTDPKESAEEIDKILQQQALKKKLAHGS